MNSRRQEWPERFWSDGFDRRTFLSRSEWETYLRRAPVRYTRSEKAHKMPPTRICGYCHRAGNKKNRLQLAHRISALNGVRYLALTPEFLDRQELLVWAHLKVCNRKIELAYPETLTYLKDHGIDRLPDFLPRVVQKDWRRLGP